MLSNLLASAGALLRVLNRLVDCLGDSPLGHAGVILLILEHCRAGKTSDISISYS